MQKPEKPTCPEATFRSSHRTCRTFFRASRLFSLLLCLGTFPDSVRAGSCSAVGHSYPQAVVFENEPYARVLIDRQDTSLAETVRYHTADGIPTTTPTWARAGVHYVAQSGAVSFAIGQATAFVDIPILDNGLLDGRKLFWLALDDPPPSLMGYNSGSPALIQIEDNEMGSAVDPLFTPDFYLPSPTPEYIANGGRTFMASLANGKIAVSGGPAGLALLTPRGELDEAFIARLKSRLDQLVPLQLLENDRILALEYVVGKSDFRLIRIDATGELELSVTPPQFNGVAIGQSDGRIVIQSTDSLRVMRLERLLSDGSPDPSFASSTWTPGTYQLLAQPDGAIWVTGSRYEGGNAVLARLKPDGTPDPTFHPPNITDPAYRAVVRRGGQLLIPALPEYLQVASSGALESPFLAGQAPDISLPIVERSDGSLVGFRNSAIALWNADGVLARRLTRELTFEYIDCFVGPRIPEPALAVLPSGDCLVAGSFDRIDGFPRTHFARLLRNPPERDFRVMTPAEVDRSSESARLRIVRTGDTSIPGSVKYRTRDGTAQAGEDYLPVSGTLKFAPLEVAKDIEIPLVKEARDSHAWPDSRVSFEVELTEPSAEYSVVPSTPVAILPLPRLAPGSLVLRPDGTRQLTALGTLPWRPYILETSQDLIHWEPIAGGFAWGSSMRIETGAQRSSPQGFFRIYKTSY